MLEMTELKEKIEEVSKVVHQFKQDHEDAVTKNDTQGAEYKEKLEKFANTIADGVEANKEIKERLAKIETLSNSSIPEGENKKYESELKSHYDDFLRQKEIKELDVYLASKNIELKTLQSQSNPDGGFLVLPESLGLRKTRVFETSPMRQVSLINTISTDQAVIDIDDDDIDNLETLKEGEQPTTGDTAKTGQIKIPVHILAKQVKLTWQQMTDPQFDRLGWIQNKISRKMARAQNTAFVSGNGTKEAKGFLTNAGTAKSIDSDSTYVRGELETFKTGQAGAYTLDDIIKLTGKLKDDYYAAAQIMLKRTTFVNIIINKDGIGNYILNRTLDKKVGVPFDILGYPILFATDMPAIGSGTKPIAFGDFSEMYQIIDRTGIRIVRDDITKAPDTIIKVFLRYGGSAYGFDSVKLLELSA